MLSKIFSSFLSLVIALTGFAVPTGNRCNASFNGTFIQSWLCLWWDDETWDNEIEYMKEAGIEYLILQTTMSFTDADTAEIYYPSQLPCFDNCEKYGDFIGDALKHCQNTGIKVFVGLADFSDWWVFAGLTPQYNTICDKMTSALEEIYNKYYEDYEDTFYGWYFTPEINNIISMKLSINNIIRGFNKIIDKATELNPSMPMLMSPYFTDYLTIPSVLCALPIWQTFMQKAHLRDGDIFCPQDGVGAGWVKLENVERVWQMYSSAVSVCQSDIKFWANIENMTVGRAFVPLMPPATVEESNATSTLNRFVEQMNIASKYVENIITFSYNHYYSPNTVNDVYHKTYLDYLDNGELDRIAPSEAENILISDGVLTWDEATDNIGIAYYLVYENKKAVKRIESGDELKYPANKNKKYSVVAFDGAGNASSKVYAERKTGESL